MDYSFNATSTVASSFSLALSVPRLCGATVKYSTYVESKQIDT